MSETISKKRLESVDILKGLSIIIVAFYHVCEKDTNEIVKVSYDNAFGFIAMVLGVFFLLAGYFFKPGRSYLANIKNRIKNLYIPFLILMAVTCVISIIAELIINGEVSVWQYVSNYFLRLYDPASFLEYGRLGLDGSLIAVFLLPCWFMVRLFFCELLFYAIADFALKKVSYFAITIVALLTITTLYDVFIPVNFAFQLQAVFAITALMLAGAFAAKYNLIGRLEACKKGLKYWLCVIGIMAAYFVVGRYLYNYQGFNLSAGSFGHPDNSVIYAVYLWFICNIISVAAFTVISSWIAKIPFIRKPLSFCGTCTATILCLHLVLSWIIVKCINPSYRILLTVFAGEDTKETPFWVQAIAMLGSIIICCLIEFFKKKIKKAIAVKKQAA